MAAGTIITVTAKVSPPSSLDTPVKQVNFAFGNNGASTHEEVIFPCSATTNFTFQLSDGGSNIHTLTTAVVTISMTGPNGTASANISGILWQPGISGVHSGTSADCLIGLRFFFPVQRS